ncbi:Type I phosphodiesterase / nucleotide pyrophosphatase [Aquisphaera giovannonii]|uniref:Type I phosphodiesterase / nucleotide pyrophosphatase n=2 Tax=Aquisphaera giovannonii TaxID=406548 RepID=A0A5B9WB58_9BACT|nr:Type I phosphodiesterase / nucleotide pyrophosphatase [Aquisphaera giovannonii]
MGSAPAPTMARPRGSEPARRLVLVVIDGLRAETAFNADLMPTLNRLASRGGRTTARVESLIPSSLAGIVALISGDVPPAESCLSDFGAAPRREGGVLEAVARAGGRSFVAGPSLWTDLYGTWIASAEVDPTFGSGDERLVAAALRALSSDSYRLIVLHVGRVDAAAHRSGTRSAMYRGSVRWCDEVVRRIAREMGQGTGLVVTSDHGMTEDGGHAGPEPSVLTTPLVTFGAGLPTGAWPGGPQRAVPSLLLTAIGIEPSSGDTSAYKDVEPGARIFLPLTAGLLCGLYFWSGMGGASSGRTEATILNLAVWLVLLLIIMDRLPAALAAGFATLAWAVSTVPRKPSRVLTAAVASGALLGALRLIDGYFALDLDAWTGLAPVGAAVMACSPLAIPAAAMRRDGPTAGPLQSSSSLTGWLGPAGMTAMAALLGGASLVLAYLAAIMLGRAVATILAMPRGVGRSREGVVSPFLTVPRSRFVSAGVLTACALVLLCRIAGQTPSLSTVDVRSAFGLVEIRGGLALAVVAVAAAQALPAVGLLLGLRVAVGRLSPDSLTDFAAGLAAALAGQAAAGALLLDATPGQPVDALALGLLIRVLAEGLYLFLGLAALVLAARATETAGA